MEPQVFIYIVLKSGLLLGEVLSTLDLIRSDFLLYFTHRHLSNRDCLLMHTACLVCFISTVNGRSKKRKEAY